MEKGKLTEDYEKAVAICELDANALAALGIENGETVVVKTELGRINVKAKLNKQLHEGMAFIPCGPYFNYLLDAYTQFTGMPGFKSIEATIDAAPGSKVSTIEELTQMMKEVP
jgi:formylmethanofuran dehydrogenase subunit D